MPIDRVRALYVDEETTFRSDPSANGSGYGAVELMNAPYPVNEMRLDESNFAIGRNARTDLIPVQDGASLDCEIAATGYAAASLEGGSASTADPLDYILASALGQSLLNLAGQGVDAGSTTSNAVLAAAHTGLAVGDVLPIFFAAAHAADYELRTHWRGVTVVSGAPTYTVGAPVWPEAPVTDDVAPGMRIYGKNASLAADAPSLAAAVDVDGTLHSLLGGQATTLALNCVAGQKASFRTKLQFDYWETGVSKASLPAITTMPAPLRGVYSGFYFGGTEYLTGELNLDFQLKARLLAASAGANGRTRGTRFEIDPVLTVTPAYAPSTWHNALRVGTIGTLLATFGAGQNSSGRLNAYAFYARRAQIIKVDEAPEDGYIRHNIQIAVLDPGDGGRHWVFAKI